MKKFLLQPLFLIGLIIRLAMIFTVLPLATVQWFAPFLDITTTQFSLDPWSVYLENGGDLKAFPYGYVMWLILLPFTFLMKIVGLSSLYGYGLTLLAVDFSLLLVIKKSLKNRDRLLLALYWLSPIVLLSTYWYGHNDLIPVLMLALALHFTRQRQLFYSGVFCAAAISAKLSMILVVPFFLVYLIRNRAMKQLLLEYLKGIGLCGLIFGIPFLFSESALNMLIKNPEMGKVYQFVLSIGYSVHIYVVPLVYLVVLYTAWRVHRLNFELFNVMLGLIFLLVVLLTPASPGWFIWIMPLLVTYQLVSGRVAIALVGVLSGLYVINLTIIMPASSLSFYFQIEHLSFNWFSQSDSHIRSLLHTGITAIGIVLALRIWRESVKFNDYFRLSRKPFVIGIAGDSGSGKDTLVNSLEGLFGTHSVTKLSGDDYHFWDRHKPIWEVMTHLNPMANDLESFTNDLISLTNGRSVHSRHYDHVTGKKSRPIYLKSNDFIIVSGLHALYLPLIRDCHNLRIYLDIDEKLRRHFKLLRDVGSRGQSVEKVLSLFDKRESDSVRFIRPQASHADLILSLQPINTRIVEKDNSMVPLRFKLVVRSRHGLNEFSLNRVLVGVCGLHVDMVVNNDATEVEIVIEGETSAEDIALAAKMICPRIFEFLDIIPQWQDGVIGLMQLVTLSHISHALTKRFL